MTDVPTTTPTKGENHDWDTVTPDNNFPTSEQTNNPTNREEENSISERQGSSDNPLHVTSDEEDPTEVPTGEDACPAEEIRKAFPKKITGNEPHSITNFLLAILALIAKYDMTTDSIYPIISSRVSQGTCLHETIKESKDRKENWPNLLLGLYKKFPGYLYNQGNLSYINTLRQLSEYKGTKIRNGTKTLTVLAMFLNIHDLARAFSKAAKRTNIAGETYRQLREKVFLANPILIQPLLLMEKKAKNLGMENFDTLFLHIAYDYCNGFNTLENGPSNKVLTVNLD